MDFQNPLSNALQQWSVRITRRLLGDFMRFASSNNLSMPQVSVLMHLYYNGPASILAIRREFQGSRAAASQLVDKLVHMDLVERTEDKTDRRVKAICLTPKGTELIGENIAAHLHWLDELSASFSQEEQVRFSLVLDGIIRQAHNMEQQEMPVLMVEEIIPSE